MSSTIQHSLEPDTYWNEEWAMDWINIIEIFNTIEKLETLFAEMDVSILRQLSQQKLILGLQHYAYSLSKVIEQKYA